MDSLLRSKEVAVLIVLCEDPAKGSAASGLELAGKIALTPFLWKKYAHRIWLIGEQATPTAFFLNIKSALAQYALLDIFIFAHGSTGVMHFANGDIDRDRLAKELYRQGGNRIRMVYSSTCYGGSMLKAWQHVGAWAARGAKGVNRPLDFPRFLIAWLRGKRFEDASRVGYRWNTFAHLVFNFIRPVIKIGCRTAKATLERIKPQTQNWRSSLIGFGINCITVLNDWFEEKWDIQESFPFGYGKDVRITDMKRPVPSQKTFV